MNEMIYFVNNRLRSNKTVLNAFKRLADVLIASGRNVSFDSVCEISSSADLIELFKLRAMLSRGDKVVCPTFYTLFLCRLMCIGKGIGLVYWVQGDIAEESYLRNGSSLKKNIVGVLNKVAIQFSDGCILVSKEMKKKFGKLTDNIVIPCISTLTYRDVVKEEGSYCYIGGLSAWQKIDWMFEYVAALKREGKIQRLYIATADCQKAWQLAELYDLYEITDVCTLHDEDSVADFLSSKQYGFLFRDESPVNYVSSPIKLAEYLSCGVHVLISPAVRSYAIDIEASGAGSIIKDHRKVVHSFNPNYLNSLKKYESTFSVSSCVNRIRSCNFL